MRVAIIAEGRSDLAVLKNILKGTLNIDKSEIFPMLPEYSYDQTDLFEMAPEEFSNWTLVREECLSRERIAPLFDVVEDDNRFLVIQIDTAERFEVHYEVNEPPRIKDSKEYCWLLRGNVINRINHWLNNHFIEKIAYAITIEETEAWILAIYVPSNKKMDTSTFPRPKERSKAEIPRIIDKKDLKSFNNAKVFEQYDFLSAPLSKQKKGLAYAMSNNESLKLFCESLKVFKLPSES